MRWNSALLFFHDSRACASHFYCALPAADCLEGIIELDVASKVKKVNDEAALVFGLPASSLVGENIHKVGEVLQCQKSLNLAQFLY